MAKFLNQAKPEPLSGMSLIGNRLSCERRQRAYRHARAVGLNPADAEACVSGMAEQYERDNPYGAQEHAMKVVDLTGHYRLMAALLASETWTAG